MYEFDAAERVIILDVETTGLDPHNGDRIIEIGCVALIGEFRTGESFQCYLYPERSIPLASQRIHGISDKDLEDKPRFAEIAGDFLKFIADAPLIAHNMSFDGAFLNMELRQCGQDVLSEARLYDTLENARKLFPNARNSLDALCKRFNIPADRDLHGALKDAELLAEVYIRLLATSRQRATADMQAHSDAPQINHREDGRPLREPRSPRYATDEEQQAHRKFITESLKEPILWLENEAGDHSAN